MQPVRQSACLTVLAALAWSADPLPIYPIDFLPAARGAFGMFELEAQ